MTTVLVTGVSGHVGGHLARRVFEGGLSVRALVRTQEQAEEAGREGWIPVQGDLTKPTTLRGVCDGVDLVLHSAAYMGKPGPLYQTVNVDGTRELAEGALAAGVRRFVQISTMSVYGEPLPPALTEESPLSTEDAEPYCATKARAEIELQKIRVRGLTVTILRPGMITHWSKSQWGNEMVERIRARGWPAFLHPDDVMPWVHTSNLAEMSYLSLTHPTPSNDAFIAVDRNVAIRDFYGPIAAALGKPIVLPDRGPTMSFSTLGKISNALGYSPVYSFEETVARLVELANSPAPNTP
jgi:nucleoside-diphosphate-sugar epimerase